MKENIGFLGAGAMGEALIRGLIRARLVPASQIVAWDVRQERLRELKAAYGLETAIGREDLTARADIILLAVKPQNVKEALDGIQIGNGKLVISIIAGVTLAELASFWVQCPW